MLKKTTFLVLGLALVLFSGCVSHNKYRGLETELKSAQIQMEEDEIVFRNLQVQNEKLLNETTLLLEENENLKLELKKENFVVAQTESKNSKPDTFTDEIHSPYSILLSSCRQKESLKRVLSEYKMIDMEPYVVKADLGEKGIWWRVFAGHYKTRELAIIEKNKYGLSENIVLKITDSSYMDAHTIENEAENKAALIVKK